MEREQTTIRLPSELKEEIQKQADRMGVSFNEITIKLMREGLKDYSVVSTEISPCSSS